MIWGLLLTLHLVGLVGYNLLLRKAVLTHRFHPWVLATLLETGIALPIIVAIPFLSIDLTRFTAQSIVLSVGVVGLSMVLLFAITKALYSLEASTYSVVYNLRIILATLLAAALLGEFPTQLQLLGGLLIVAAIVIVRQKGSRAVTRRGVLWALLAAAIISIENVIEKQLINDIGVFTGAPVIALATSVVMWAIVVAKRYSVPRKYLLTKQVIGLMVLRSLAAWGFIFAMAAGALVSIATVVSASGLIIIVLCGIVFLHERDHLRRKILAVVLAAFGTALILIGTQPPVSHVVIVKKAQTITNSTDIPSEEKPNKDYVWRGSLQDPKKIVIPSIGVDAYIQNVGIDQKNEIAVPNNIHIAGWFADSVLPGKKGLSIIDGHLDGLTQNGIFDHLIQVQPGVTFSIEFGDGTIRLFKVRSVHAVPLDSAAEMLFSQDPSLSNELKLITCGGQYNKNTHLYDKRIIVSSTMTE